MSKWIEKDYPPSSSRALVQRSSQKSAMGLQSTQRRRWKRSISQLPTSGDLKALSLNSPPPLFEQSPEPLLKSGATFNWESLADPEGSASRHSEAIQASSDVSFGSEQIDPTQLHQWVKCSYAHLNGCQELLKEKKVPLIEMDHIWAEVCRNNSSDESLQFLNTLYQSGQLNSSEAYFFYTQNQTRQQLNVSPLSTIPPSTSSHDPISTGPSWSEKISGFGALISFTGLLAHAYRGATNFYGKVPDWLKRPEIFLASFESRYRELLNGLHFSVRLPLETLWSPRAMSVQESSHWFNCFSGPASSSKEMIASWAQVPAVQKIQSVGAISGSILSTLGAAWGIFCSAVSGKIGEIAENHGEKVFEWGEKVYSQWSTSPSQPVKNAPLRNASPALSHPNALSPAMAMNIGVNHFHTMIEKFPTELNFPSSASFFNVKK